MPDQFGNPMPFELPGGGQLGQNPATYNIPGVASWAPGIPPPRLQATGGIPQPQGLNANMINALRAGGNAGMGQAAPMGPPMGGQQLPASPQQLQMMQNFMNLMGRKPGLPM